MTFPQPAPADAQMEKLPEHASGAIAPSKQTAHQSLPRAASLALLGPGGHGRVAATMGAIPIIVPVSFTLCGDNVIFVAGPGAVPARAVADSVVAFETDHLGTDGRTDWEVHVTGVATALKNQNEVTVFRLPSTILTGWRASR